MAKYLDSDGVAYLWSKIKNKFAPLASPSLTGTPTAPTATAGTNTTQVATTAFVKAAIDAIPGGTDTKNTTGSTNSASKLYLVGALDQSANPVTYSSSKVYETDGDLVADSFSGMTVAGNGNNVAGWQFSGLSGGDGTATLLWPVGSTTLGAAASKAVGSVASGNTGLVTGGDVYTAIQNKADNDTKNTAGSNNSTSKIFLVGTTSQTTGTNGLQSYSNVNCYASSGHLYSNGLQVVNLSGSQALTNKTYNGYTLAAACAKGVDTSISAGSTSTNLPTSAAVASLITTATTGALNYQGVVTAQSGLGTTYKKGYYWIVGSVTAGTTIAGQVVETGDMILAHADYSGTIANDVDVVQSNVDRMTNTDIDNAVTAGEVL